MRDRAHAPSQFAIPRNSIPYRWVYIYATTTRYPQGCIKSDSRDLVLYYRPTCPVCVRVTNYIDRNGIQVKLRNISKDPHDGYIYMRQRPAILKDASSPIAATSSCTTGPPARSAFA